jgi:hypothetical protein
MTDNDKPSLNTNQRRALQALLSEPTIRAAAEKAELGEATIYRYLRDEFFRDELRRRQDEILTATAAALVGLRGKALETLANAQDDDDVSVRVRAANYWLRHVRDAVKLDDLADRVRALEEADRMFEEPLDR